MRARIRFSLFFSLYRDGHEVGVLNLLLCYGPLLNLEKPIDTSEQCLKMCKKYLGLQRKSKRHESKDVFFFFLFKLMIFETQSQFLWEVFEPSFIEGDHMLLVIEDPSRN